MGVELVEKLIRVKFAMCISADHTEKKQARYTFTPFDWGRMAAISELASHSAVF